MNCRLCGDNGFISQPREDLTSQVTYVRCSNKDCTAFERSLKRIREQENRQNMTPLERLEELDKELGEESE